MEEEQNYGRPRKPGDPTDDPTGSPTGGPVGGLGREEGGAMSPQDEQTWSMLSHLSVLAWPVTGFLPVAPLLVWLVYKDRSPRVGFHALQSLWYQVAWLVLGTIGGFLATVFTILTLGLGIFVVVPLAVVLGLIPFVHQLYAAYKVYQGVDYRYPYIADRIDGGQRIV
jgi:uncharacterized Tic20 family protein